MVEMTHKERMKNLKIALKLGENFFQNDKDNISKIKSAIRDKSPTEGKYKNRNAIGLAKGITLEIGM